MHIEPNRSAKLCGASRIAALHLWYAASEAHYGMRLGCPAWMHKMYVHWLGAALFVLSIILCTTLWRIQLKEREIKTDRKQIARIFSNRSFVRWIWSLCTFADDSELGSCIFLKSISSLVIKNTILVRSPTRAVYSVSAAAPSKATTTLFSIPDDWAIVLSVYPTIFLMRDILRALVLLYWFKNIFTKDQHLYCLTQ